MTKVNIKGIPEIEKNIQKTFDKVLDSAQMKTQIGEFVVGRLRAEARRAKPLNDTRSFPSLSKQTVSRRGYLSAINTTHPTFKPSRSNTTITGQLLNAIVFKLLGRGGIEVNIEDTVRDPYIINRKGEISEVDTNREVADDLKSRGFILFTSNGLKSEEKIMNRINSIVKSFVRRAIKVNFRS